MEQDIADVNNLSEGDLVEKVIFEVLPIKDGDVPETKASAVPDGGTVSLAWEVTDTVGIFPKKGSQVFFSMESGAGTSSANFDGGDWALKQGSLYVSYYPLVGEFYLDRTKIPVSFAGQKQIGTSSPFHGARYFLATEPTSSENGVLRFSYSTLNTIINVNATLPAGTYTKMSLTIEEPLFVEEGTYSLDDRVIVGSKFTNTLEIDLENVTLTQEGILPIYIMSAPVDLKGKEVTVRIISSKGQHFECIKTPSKAYEAGTRYGLTCDNMEVAVTTKNYLSFTSEEDGSTISLVNYGNNLPNVEYSFNGLSWTIWDYSEIVLNSDETVYMRGNNENGFSSSTEDYYTTDYSTFIMTGSIAANGNIMSLLYSDDFDSHDSIPAKSCFYYLFNGATSLTSAPELPALSLSSRCYSGMFQGCTSLLDAPNLPATELASQCYQLMFNGCCNLINAPVISSMKMEYDCCNAMFMNCTSLEAAPELPATELEGLCYSNMFMGCTSLVTAPNLPATELASDCYQYMFHGCVSLLNAPSLPATVLAGGCYYGMFIGCTSLTTAPELPATMLQYQCYWYMFDGCSNLSYIKMLATDISASGCLSGWVISVH